MNAWLSAFVFWPCVMGLVAPGRAEEKTKGVRISRQTVQLQGRTVKVDLYEPVNDRGAPVAILAHGFTREPKFFKAWGQVLAENGITTAIPELPFFSNHAGNARGMTELLILLQKGGLGQGVRPSGKAAFLGHSAGSLSALLAAEEMGDQVECWVGLDPVDSRGLGLSAAASQRVPSLMFFAEPGLFNRRCKALNWVPAYGGPIWALHVDGSSHADPEKPTSLLSRLFVGGWDEARHAIYEEYTLAILKWAFFGDVSAERRLQLSCRDKRVTVLRKDVEEKPK